MKQPRYTSHPSLNFEQGEVIYENSRILEWIRGIQIGSVALIAYFGVVLPLNIGFKTNLVTDMADEFLKKSLHYTSPFQVDYLKLFTPVATVGVYYVLYSVMRMITEMGAQYAVKVSYSKDRVGCVLCRNYCSSRGLIPSGSYRKMFTKPRTWRYSRHHHDQGWLI